jgi:hypothetical protein
MVDQILRQGRIPKPDGASPIEAKRVGISAAQLARLEANQRGLYVEALDGIAEALRCARNRPIPALPIEKI